MVNYNLKMSIEKNLTLVNFKEIQGLKSNYIVAYKRNFMQYFHVDSNYQNNFRKGDEVLILIVENI